MLDYEFIHHSIFFHVNNYYYFYANFDRNYLHNYTLNHKLYDTKIPPSQKKKIETLFSKILKFHFFFLGICLHVFLLILT